MFEDENENATGGARITPEQLQILKMTELLSANPKVRPKLQGLIKEAFPDVMIPEYEAMKMVETRIADFEAKQQKKEEEERNRKIAEYAEKGRGLFKSNGFTDEEIKGIEDRMVKFDIPQDYEKALTWVKREREFSAPRSMAYEPATFRMPDNKGLWENPDKWALDEAHRAVDEILQQNK